MRDLALRVENLGKQYRLSEGAAGGYYRYKSLRDTLGGFARHPRRALPFAGRTMTADNSFWALSGIDFEINRGEAVGIIGRNGAGKSTLLKVLSRITRPTTGKVDLFGRVGSLLEVGTGFHPELSGRENIFLNGAILGMSRAEVNANFDEIVAFSEVEKFLDTPVKQYSSGMYMRLAFAVAAHLETEILVVDEVLAVGDAEFQSKCLGKMKSVANAGRTVLFVSHNVGLVRALCTQGIVLDRGRVLMQGDVVEATDLYLRGTACHDSVDLVTQNGLTLQRIACLNDADEPQRDFLFTEAIALRLEFRASAVANKCAFWLRFKRRDGTMAGSACSLEEGFGWHQVGNTTATIRLPRAFLLPGEYTVDVQVSRLDHHPLFELEEATTFVIHPAPLGDAAAAYRQQHGVCRLASEFKVSHHNAV